MKIFIAILVAVTVTQAGILETKSRNQKARPRGSDAPMDVKVEAVEPEIEPEDEPEPTVADGEFQELSDSIEQGLRTCGLAGTKIVNGIAAEENSWPWIVRLVLYFGAGTATESAGSCGGTIIDENSISFWIN